MLQILALFLVCTAAAAELQCTVIPGSLKQVDAGAGEVYGVNNNDDIYHWVGNDWQNIPGKLIHVTVGPAGVWGANSVYNIYKLQNNTWKPLSGLLKQVDAGGNKFISGVNMNDAIFCLNEGQTDSTPPDPSYTGIDGSLKYYSCGLRGCWGANRYSDIYYRYNVKPTACQGSEWRLIPGSLVMVEVGTDGSVYGVDSNGDVFYREGVTAENPIGTSWIKMDFSFSIRHVTYDAGFLWLLSLKGEIFKCKVNGAVFLTA